MSISTEKKCLLANALGAFALAMILIVAFFFQFSDKEVPCPLCLLQRAGFLLMGFALIMNLRFGLKASHYMLGFLGAILTILSSLRQILLHIIPGTGTYGGAIFSWHLYTWSFIASFGFLCATCVGLWCQSQLNRSTKAPSATTYKPLFYVLLFLLLAISLTNTVSTYMECGLNYCPSNPSGYPHKLL